MEVTDLRILFGRLQPGSSPQCFVTKILNTPEDKMMAYELILQQAFEVFPIITPLNLTSDSVSTAAFKVWVLSRLNDNVVIGCYTEPQHELVAVDFLNFRQIGASPLPPCQLLGEPFFNFIQYLDMFHDHVQAKCEQIDQNSHWYEYITSFGVFTRPAYKYQDIQKQMINMREQVARACGIQVIASAFIREEMQVVANELTYKEFKVFNHVQIALLGWDFTCYEVFPIIQSIKSRAPACVCSENYS